MEDITVKRKFKKRGRSIISIIKEKIVNEVNTIAISMMISLAVSISVCIPAKDFMFKEHSVTYGATYKILLTLQYQIAPISIIIISSFLVAYIFNKEYIKKLYYIYKNKSKGIFKSFKYIFRIITLFIVLIILSKFIIGPKIIPQITNEEEMMKYLYNNSIILGTLLTIISCYLVFWGVNKSYSDILLNEENKEKQAKKEGLTREYLLECKDLNKKYIDVFNGLIKNKVFIYENSEIRDFLNYNDSNTQYNLSIIKDEDTLMYKKTRDFIEYHTNEGKYFNFDNQINNITNKYGQFELDTIKKHFYNLLGIDLCSQSLSCINYLERKYLNTFKDKELDFYISEFKKYLQNLVNINSDIDEYLKNRMHYLENSHQIAERGYNGEFRVKQELDKYKDYFINIENKCFNFKYIDFIQENYTMECDNILITQRGIFIIETKNNGENSVYIDETTGKTYNKYVLHIESDGRWIFRDNSGGFKVLDKTPVEQNRDHVLKLEKIINHHLGYDKFNDNYIEIRSIIVMANKNIKIENDLDGIIDVCRPDAIFETVMKYPKNPIFTREMIQKIIDIINSYEATIHKPNLYSLVNVDKELNSLEYTLNNTIVDRTYFYDINRALKSYYEDLESLNKKFLEEVNNI